MEGSAWTWRSLLAREQRLLRVARIGWKTPNARHRVIPGRGNSDGAEPPRLSAYAQGLIGHEHQPKPGRHRDELAGAVIEDVRLPPAFGKSRDQIGGSD